MEPNRTTKEIKEENQRENEEYRRLQVDVLSQVPFMPQTIVDGPSSQNPGLHCTSTTVPTEYFTSTFSVTRYPKSKA